MNDDRRRKDSTSCSNYPMVQIAMDSAHQKLAWVQAIRVATESQRSEVRGMPMPRSMARGTQLQKTLGMLVEEEERRRKECPLPPGT